MENISDEVNWEHLGSNIQVIAPGLVFIKNALNKEQQQWLANYAMQAGSREDNGFWINVPSCDTNANNHSNNGGGSGESAVVGTSKRVLNSDKARGRIYDDIERFPDSAQVQSLCHSLVDYARQNDPKMPQMDPTHLLLLYYASEDGMEWHSDSDVNDGNNDHPIVSITIGNACDFGYKLVGKAAQSIRLESGDVLIWGGPNRMLFHCVERVYGNTVPDFIQDIIGNVRLNFTYRDAPNVRGREKEFKYNLDGFNISEEKTLNQSANLGQTLSH